MGARVVGCAGDGRCRGSLFGVRRSTLASQVPRPGARRSRSERDENGCGDGCFAGDEAQRPRHRSTRCRTVRDCRGFAVHCDVRRADANAPVRRRGAGGGGGGGGGWGWAADGSAQYGIDGGAPGGGRTVGGRRGGTRAVRKAHSRQGAERGSRAATGMVLAEGCGAFRAARRSFHSLVSVGGRSFQGSVGGTRP